MNRQQFIAYIDTPDKLSGEDSVLLAEMVKNFPYFQTAQLLYTKSLHNQHSIHYNNQLKITAAYATSRKRLHELITKKVIVEDIQSVKTEKSIIENLVEEETVTTIDVVATSVIPEIKKKRDETVAEKAITEIVTPAIAQVTELPVKEEVISIKETISEVQNREPIVPEINETHTEVVAEKTIMETPVSTIVQVTEQPLKTEVVKAVDEALPPVSKISPAPILAEITKVFKEAIVIEKEVMEPPIATIVETPELPVEEEIKERLPTTVDVPEEQIDDLQKNYLHEAAIASVEIDLANTPLHIKESSPVVVEETNFVLNTPDVVQEAKKTEHLADIEEEQEEDFNLTEAHTFGEWLKHLPKSEKSVELQKPKIVKEKQKAEPIGLKKSKNDLIDKFLKEEPRIKPRTEFFNPANVAKQSVADDITFVSETLAKIYLLQENYSKAIEAYENLRLKYPEKRLYFATQIKKIRKLINPTN